MGDEQFFQLVVVSVLLLLWMVRPVLGCFLGHRVVELIVDACHKGRSEERSNQLHHAIFLDCCIISLSRAPVMDKGITLLPFNVEGGVTYSRADIKSRLKGLFRNITHLPERKHKVCYASEEFLG
jgi:hypothetical protein